MSAPPAAVVAAAVVALVAVRVWFLRLHRQPSVDESGYLAVARQWHGPGHQVYGAYFLDRPPLLVGLYRLGNEMGGVTGLQVLGLLCAVVAVLAVAAAAGRVAGRLPAAVAAVLAAALLATPATDAFEVNGELLSAPFIAVGLAATVAALTTVGRRGLGYAAAAGLAGVVAVLVKQNMFDVLVFLVAAAVLGSRRLGRRRALALVAAGAGGAVLGLVAVLAWAWHEGSGPRELLFATYGFRLQASSVLADRSGYDEHATALVREFLVSGLALGVVVALSAAWPARRRRDVTDVVALALAVTLVYDAVSVVSGQQYWTHYLIQLVVPLSIAVGVLSARWRWPAAVVAGFAVVSCVAATATLPAVSSTVVLDHRLGHALASVSRPGDTVLAFPGHGDVTYASGLPSPYPYLWRLQSETLDPDLSRLYRLLDGRSAPTWVVDFPNLGLDVRQRAALHQALTAHYDHVGHFGDGQVYRLAGVRRDDPPGRAGSRGGQPSDIGIRTSRSAATSTARS